MAMTLITITHKVNPTMTKDKYLFCMLVLVLFGYLSLRYQSATTTEPKKTNEKDATIIALDETRGVDQHRDEDQQEILLNEEILPRLERIKKICGTLCEVDSMEKLSAITIKSNSKNSLILPHVRAHVDCQAIMASEDIDASENSVPYPLPKRLHSLYSLNGSVEIVHWKQFKSIYLGQNALENHWDEEKIKTIMLELENGTHEGSYGFVTTNKVLKHLKITGKIRGSRVLVIGSQRPWIEAICLLLGAKEVVTLEYGKIVSTHPKIKTLTPHEFREEYLNGKLGLFDTIVSYSSVEHSGLGRYGDALNPWGDLLAIARSWCVTKPGGALVLGIPTGRDRVVMNAHRIYGAVRWPLISANWMQVDHKLHNVANLLKSEGQDQPLFVFAKLEGI